MNHPTKLRSDLPSTMRLIPGGGRLLITLLLVGFALTFLSNCKSKEEREGPKPYKPKRVRDPMDQRVFYDGWWPKHW